MTRPMELTLGQPFEDHASSSNQTRLRRHRIGPSIRLSGNDSYLLAHGFNVWHETRMNGRLWHAGHKAVIPVRDLFAVMEA